MCLFVISSMNVLLIVMFFLRSRLVWDTRTMARPLKEYADLPNLFPFTDAIFSPNDRFFLTGTSVKKNQAGARLIFYDKGTLEPVKQIAIAGSVVRLLWHPKINQLVVGCGDNSTRVLYDPDRSSKGALLTLVRRERKVDPSEFDLGVEGYARNLSLSFTRAK